MGRVGAFLRSRRLRIGLVVALGVAVVLGVGSLRSALSARRSLSQGRDALSRGRDLLADGDAAGAAADFGRAASSFRDALGEANGPWLGVVGRVPLVGRTPDAVHAIADAGVRVSTAGSTLARALDAAGGISALAPSHGRIPVEPIEELAPAVAAAAREVGAAVDTLDEAPGTLLIGPVGSAMSEAREQIGSLDELLRTASDVLEGLPSFLGADGPRHYFFGAQNPAELRGTGGVVGAYSILTIDDGLLAFSPFRPIQSLPLLSVEDVPGPTEEYASNYDQFRGDGRFWLAINTTPDFPTAARAIVDAYAVATGERLDGVILADPFALEALMRLTGPARVPGLDVTLTADRVVAFTANEAYSLLTDPEARKRLLGAVAQTVVGRFLQGGDLEAGDVRSLARAAGRGHVLVYSVDPAIQEALERTGAGGALRSGTGDLLSVVENSSGGNKVDFYEDRSVSYEVWLRADGSARATATITLANDAPTTGQPKYVIGPYRSFSEAGESAQIVNVYCGDGCSLIRAERDGARIGVRAGSELGNPFFQDSFRTPSGETSELSLTWYLPRAWEGDSLGGVYRLTLLDQPTIRPDATSVVVHLPDGMEVSGASPDVQGNQDTASWDASLDGRREVFVEFRPPALTRLWRLLTPG